MSEFLLSTKPKKNPKTKPSGGTTVVRESRNMSPSLMLAADLALAYAGTKKRWFRGKKGWDGSTDEYGLTLDPSVTGERDFRKFRNLVIKLKRHYGYSLL